MPFSFRAYGLSISSSFALHELSKEETHPTDVVVEKGKALISEELHLRENYFEFDTHRFLFYWKDTGAFVISEGNKIVVGPNRGVADHLLRPALLGPVLSALLYQRGHLILHASAVALRSKAGEAAIAFLGNSGQGKSTMATALFKRGHRALADDNIAIPRQESSLASHSTEPSQFQIHPGLPHLKLRKPSLDMLDEESATRQRWHPELPDYIVDVPHDILLPAPLRALYVLEDASSIYIEALPPEEALNTVLYYSYGTRIFGGFGMRDDFISCAQLIRRVPVFRLKRPRDFRLLPDVVRFVEEHERSLGAI